VVFVVPTADNATLLIKRYTLHQILPPSFLHTVNGVNNAFPNIISPRVGGNLVAFGELCNLSTLFIDGKNYLVEVCWPYHSCNSLAALIATFWHLLIYFDSLFTYSLLQPDDVQYYSALAPISIVPAPSLTIVVLWTRWYLLSTVQHYFER
jgi:hypothetical protein